ncbi:MAG: hypothetical protein U7123_04345 [Potamolinea sp.]
MLTMVKELHAHQKAPSLSTVTPVTKPFQSRPFAVQTKPEHSSPQQELPDSETQQETVKCFGHSLANISISAPSAPPPDAWKQPLLQRKYPEATPTPHNYLRSSQNSVFRRQDITQKPIGPKLTVASSEMILPYRNKGAFNFGKVDEPGLKEEQFKSPDTQALD